LIAGKSIMSAHSRQTSEPDRITRPQPAEVRKETYDSLDSLMEGIFPEDIFSSDNKKQTP
jgi:hypothetical protein